MAFNVEMDSVASVDTLSLAMPKIPGLNPRQRLEALIPLLHWDTRRGSFALEGDLLVAYSTRQLTTYRLVELDEESARQAIAGLPEALNAEAKIIVGLDRESSFFTTKR